MPYLSKDWSLAEVVAWVAIRLPRSLADGHLDFDFDSDRLGTPQRKLKHAVDEVLLAISSGGLSVRARSVSDGRIAIIPLDALSNLEFHVAVDIPGCPCGFRNIGSRVLEWVEPTIPSAQATAQWPR